MKLNLKLWRREADKDIYVNSPGMREEQRVKREQVSRLNSRQDYPLQAYMLTHHSPLKRMNSGDEREDTAMGSVHGHAAGGCSEGEGMASPAMSLGYPDSSARSSQGITFNRVGCRRPWRSLERNSFPQLAIHISIPTHDYVIPPPGAWSLVTT